MLYICYQFKSINRNNNNEKKGRPFVRVRRDRDNSIGLKATRGRMMDKKYNWTTTTKFYFHAKDIFHGVSTLLYGRKTKKDTYRSSNPLFLGVCVHPPRLRYRKRWKWFIILFNAVCFVFLFCSFHKNIYTHYNIFSREREKYGIIIGERAAHGRGLLSID